MQALIRIKHLTRRYGEIRAVNDISFELHAGEVLGFLGPNGAGKSTTMRIISGGLAPSSGSIQLNGVDLLEHPLQAKAGLGYLPERPPLYKELTVDEYLGHVASLRGIQRRQLADARDAAKAKCGLSECGRRLIANLSKGYQQRVGIAQAIIHNPKVIILDEPTSGLDPNQIQEIRGLIKQLGEECGVLLSTHILPEVEAVCHRVLILHQGVLAHEQRLDRPGRTRALSLLLGHPPAVDELNALPGVEQASAQGANRFLLRLAKEADPAMIAAHCVNRQWQLKEMSPVSDRLEQVFSRITLREAAP